MPYSEQIKIGEWIGREERLIASRLFRAITTMGFDRDQLAEIADISSAKLSDYETGREAIPASTLFILASSMGIELDYFYDSNVKICGTNVSMATSEKTTALLS